MYNAAGSQGDAVTEPSMPPGEPAGIMDEEQSS